MRRLAFLACLALPYPGGAMAQGEPELFHKPGLSCDPADVGKVGGPVLIGDTGLEMPGLSCRFSGRTKVARMDAELLDAACPVGGRTLQSRFFLNRGTHGIALVSREFGVFLLDPCPER